MIFLLAAGLSVLPILSTPCFVKPYVGFLRQPPPANKTWSLSATGCHSNPCQSRTANNQKQNPKGYAVPLGFFANKSSNEL